ncbi:hypothetical protein BGX26_003616 [Mortierella sp. AD094]|nr:hypothetical protein BGX26_003616 [Mortierella sp. AD094]
MKWVVLDKMEDQQLRQIQLIEEEIDALLKIDDDIDLLKEHLAMIQGEELEREGPKIMEEITKLEAKIPTWPGEVEKLQQEKSAIRRRISKTQADENAQEVNEITTDAAEEQNLLEEKRMLREKSYIAERQEEIEEFNKINSALSESISYFMAIRSGTTGAEPRPTAPKKRYPELNAVEITTKRRRRRRRQ